MALLRLWLVAVGGLIHAALMAAEATEPSLRVYIGTYTGPKSRGIYTARFDPATGTLTAPELAAEARNPTFLALHPNHHLLYAAEETSRFEGKPEGAINAYKIEDETGKLVLLNQQPSGGAGPCHLCVDRNGSCVLTANYNSGSIAALPLEADGRLAATSATIQHAGSSVNRERQNGPHAHFITTDPADGFALVCDLGLDKVLSYKLVRKPGASILVPNDPPAISVKPGAGPRHLAFHPNGKFVYLLNELASSMTALTYDAERGSLKELQTLSTLPEDFKGANISAEVQVHPSGRFVYGSNRGHNSITVFRVDPNDGRLTFVERQSSQGRTPRHFALAPGGQWMLVENQDSNSIVVFRVDPATGQLTPTDKQIEIAAPVCLLFLTKPVS